ncbi:hypothetical protein NUACC26_028050 [Scytonema sp. NUACC26]
MFLLHSLTFTPLRLEIQVISKSLLKDRDEIEK